MTSAAISGPDGLFDPSTLAGGRLASHQQQALEWVSERPIAVLADITGSGKTAVAGAAIGYGFDREGFTRALWVTEAHLITQTLRELRRFLPQLPCQSWTERTHEPVAVVSYDMLARRSSQLATFAAEMIVFDEASALKNAGARAEAVRPLVTRAEQRLALTATPIEVDAMESYRLLRLLGADKLLPPQHVFESFLLWRGFPNGDRKVMGVRPEALPALRDALSRYVLRREAHELDLVLPRQHRRRTPLGRGSGLPRRHFDPGPTGHPCARAGDRRSLARGGPALARLDVQPRPGSPTHRPSAPGRVTAR